MTASAAVRPDVDDEVIPAPRPCLIDVFENRAQARAILVDAELMDFTTAVDGLQEAAEAYGLIATIGQTAVQEIMSAAFAGVPR